jgi:hypothetical protein
MRPPPMGMAVGGTGVSVDVGGSGVSVGVGGNGVATGRGVEVSAGNVGGVSVCAYAGVVVGAWLVTVAMTPWAMAVIVAASS